MGFFYSKIVRRASVKRNPLTNMRALMKLNPYSAVLKKSAGAVAAARKKQKEALLAKKRAVIVNYLLNWQLIISFHIFLVINNMVNEILMLNYFLFVYVAGSCYCLNGVMTSKVYFATNPTD